MTQCITGLVGELGHFVIALLMTMENIFPPIPSEVIMPRGMFGCRWWTRHSPGHSHRADPHDRWGLLLVVDGQ